MINDKDRDIRVTGIKNVIKMGLELGQPVFCGKHAFDICVDYLDLEVHQDDFYEFGVFHGTRIILCEEMHPNNFFTCPMLHFSPSGSSGVH